MLLSTLAYIAGSTALPGHAPEGLKYGDTISSDETFTGHVACAHIYAKFILYETPRRGLQAGTDIVDDTGAIHHHWQPKNKGSFCCDDLTKDNMYAGLFYAGQVRQDRCWELLCPAGTTFTTKAWDGRTHALCV